MECFVSCSIVRRNKRYMLFSVFLFFVVTYIIIANNMSMLYVREAQLNNLTTDTFTVIFDKHTIEYENVTWKTPKAFRIVCVANATILNPSGLVFNKSGPFNFNKYYWRREEHLIKKVKQNTQIQTIAYSLVQLYSQVFQHIVFDGLSRVALSCTWLKERTEVVIVVMNKLMGELVREYCKLDVKRFHVLTKAVSFLSICVPYFEVSDLQMGELPPDTMTSLGSQTTMGHRFIYIARKKGSKRSVVNEKDVLSAISEIWPSVKVVFPINDWKKDRTEFENARVIIGPHGGAFSNMIFAPINTTIVEFLPVKSLKLRNEIDRPCFLKLAYALKFRYFSVESKLAFDFYKPMNVSISVLKDVLIKVNTSLNVT